MPYRPKTESERLSDTTEIFPVQKQLTSLYPADAVTHDTSELTESLQNPAPSIPIPHLGENQTVALRKLVAIFNMTMPQAPPTPPEKLTRVEQTPALPQKGGTHNNPLQNY